MNPYGNGAGGQGGYWNPDEDEYAEEDEFYNDPKDKGGVGGNTSNNGGYGWGGSGGFGYDQQYGYGGG